MPVQPVATQNVVAVHAGDCVVSVADLAHVSGRSGVFACVVAVRGKITVNSRDAIDCGFTCMGVYGVIAAIAMEYVVQSISRGGSGDLAIGMGGVAVQDVV